MRTSTGVCKLNTTGERPLRFKYTQQVNSVSRSDLFSNRKVSVISCAKLGKHIDNISLPVASTLFIIHQSSS